MELCFTVLWRYFGWNQFLILLVWCLMLMHKKGDFFPSSSVSLMLFHVHCSRPITHWPVTVWRDLRKHFLPLKWATAHTNEEKILQKEYLIIQLWKTANLELIDQKNAVAFHLNTSHQSLFNSNLAKFFYSHETTEKKSNCFWTAKRKNISFQSPLSWTEIMAWASSSFMLGAKQTSYTSIT